MSDPDRDGWNLPSNEGTQGDRGVSKFRKKPVVIEARQWTGANAVELLDWIKPEAIQDGDVLIIPTLEGDHEASLGDWIIKGVAREFYPCKPDIFAATYEPAE